MGNERKQAREFERDLHCQIGGKPVKRPVGSVQDYEKELLLTEKMLDSRIQPSADFERNLKQSLLLKLTQQEVQADRAKEAAWSFQNIFERLIPRSPVWRTAAVTAAVIIIAAVVIWQTGVLYRPDNSEPLLGAHPVATAGISRSQVEIKAVVSQNSLKLGTPVTVTFTFKNTGQEPVTLSPYPPQILIVASSLKPYRNIPGGESRMLTPGETAEYIFRWDQLDDEGQQVPPGIYMVEILDVQLDNGGTAVLSDNPGITITAP